MTVIQSPDNPLVKKLAAMKTKKERDRSGQFILEGRSFVDSIPESWPVDCFVCAESFHAKIDVSAYARRARVHVLADRVFKKVSDTVNPQGVLAVCGQKQTQLSALLDVPDCFLLFGEQIADPGNLGTLIRTAVAASCHGIVLSEGCVDIYNPKTLRATAGTLFRIPVVAEADASQTLRVLADNGFQLAASHVRGAVLPYDVMLTGKCCILVGNEARGLSQPTLDAADVHIKIPMAPGVESLNASIASGILLYEAVRQRISIKK